MDEKLEQKPMTEAAPAAPKKPSLKDMISKKRSYGSETKIGTAPKSKVDLTGGIKATEEFSPREIEAHKQPLDLDIATAHGQKFIPDVNKHLASEKNDGVGNYIAKHMQTLQDHQLLMDSVIDLAGENDIPVGDNMHESAAKWLYSNPGRLDELKDRYENALKRKIYLKK